MTLRPQKTWLPRRMIPTETLRMLNHNSKQNLDVGESSSWQILTSKPPDPCMLDLIEIEGMLDLRENIVQSSWDEHNSSGEDADGPFVRILQTASPEKHGIPTEILMVFACFGPHLLLDLLLGDNTL
jgi:hypothetical protein